MANRTTRYSLLATRYSLFAIRALQRVVERLTCGQRAARIRAAGLRLARAICSPLPSNIARSRFRVASDFPKSALPGEQGS
jgi:hypothetical protein